MAPSGGDSTDDANGDEAGSSDGHDVEALRAAFLAGFVTGRTGKYYGEIPPISKRAAVTKFEQYYRHKTQ